MVMAMSAPNKGGDAQNRAEKEIDAEDGEKSCDDDALSHLSAPHADEGEAGERGDPAQVGGEQRASEDGAGESAGGAVAGRAEGVAHGLISKSDMKPV
jgi:hypothetical protein